MFKKKNPSGDNNRDASPPIPNNQNASKSIFSSGLAIPKVQVDFGFHQPTYEAPPFPVETHEAPANSSATELPLTGYIQMDSQVQSEASPLPQMPSVPETFPWDEPLPEGLSLGSASTVSEPMPTEIWQVPSVPDGFPPSLNQEDFAPNPDWELSNLTNESPTNAVPQSWQNEVAAFESPSFANETLSYSIENFDSSEATATDAAFSKEQFSLEPPAFDELAPPDESLFSSPADFSHSQPGTENPAAYNVEPLWTATDEPMAIAPSASVESPASLWDRPALAWGDSESLVSETSFTSTSETVADNDLFTSFSDDDDSFDSAFDDEPLEPLPPSVNNSDLANLGVNNNIDLSADPLSWHPELTPVQSATPSVPFESASWSPDPEAIAIPDVSFDDLETASPPALSLTQQGPVVDISEPFIQELAPGPVMSPVYETTDPFLNNWQEQVSQTPTAAFETNTEQDYWRQLADSQTQYSDWSNMPVAGHQVATGQAGAAQFLDTVHDTIYPDTAFQAAGDQFDAASSLLFPETANSAPSSFSTQQVETPLSPSPTWSANLPDTTSAYTSLDPTPSIVDPELNSYYSVNGPWHDPSMQVQAEVSFDEELPQSSIAVSAPVEVIAPPPILESPVLEVRSNNPVPPSIEIIPDESFSESASEYDGEDWSLTFDDSDDFAEMNEPVVPQHAVPQVETFPPAPANILQASGDPFGLEGDWPDDGLSFEHEVDTEWSFQGASFEGGSSVSQPVELAPSVKGIGDFLTENEPLIAFAPPYQDSSTTVDAFQAVESFSFSETMDDLALQVPSQTSIPETPVMQTPLQMGTSEHLEIFHSLELTPFHRLLLVKHQQYFALMGQVGPEEDANVTVLKLFAQNPMAQSTEFLAVKEGQSADKEMFIVKLGSWQALIAVSAEQIQLHTELNQSS